MVTRFNSAINTGTLCHKHQLLGCRLGEGRGWSVPKVGHLQGVWERLPGFLSSFYNGSATGGAIKDLGQVAGAG